MVAFRPLGGATWTQAAVASPDASRYVYRNHSVAPQSPFEVKVGVYNSRGEGPSSRVVRVFSAEAGEQPVQQFLLYLACFLHYGYKLKHSNTSPKCVAKDRYILVIEDVNIFNCCGDDFLILGADANTDKFIISFLIHSP